MELVANKKQLEKSVYIVYNVGRNKREGVGSAPSVVAPQGATANPIILSGKE